MSLCAISWAFAQPVPTTQRFVLVALADYADEEGVCWPSVAKLREKTGLKDRAIQGALRALAAAGLVEEERRDGRASRFKLRMSPTHPRSRCTPAADAPPHEAPAPPQQMHPPPQQMHPEPTKESTKESLTDPPPIVPPRKRGGTRERLNGFDRFWERYPRKVGKGAAERAWPSALAAAGGEPDEIVFGLVARLHTFDDREGGRFIPHPATWLNRRGWEDDPETLDRLLAGRKVAACAMPLWRRH